MKIYKQSKIVLFQLTIRYQKSCIIRRKICLLIHGFNLCGISKNDLETIMSPENLKILNPLFLF